jgi:hypothetical protein
VTRKKRKKPIEMDTHWEQDMTTNDQGKWNIQSPLPSWNLPFDGYSVGRKDHQHCNEGKANDEGQLEVFDNTRNLDPERRFFDFFTSGTPCPVTESVATHTVQEERNSHVI